MRKAAILLVWLVLSGLTLHWCTRPSEYELAHRAGVAATIDALAAYKKEHGRYPADLRGVRLQPLPQGVELRYVASILGDACWVAFTGPHTLMPSDLFIETDCETRTTRTLDYSEAMTKPGPDVVEIR